VTDFIHLDNIIQGAVLQIRERRDLTQQEAALEELYRFLQEQGQKVLIAKLKAAQDRERVMPDLFNSTKPAHSQ